MTSEDGDYFCEDVGTWLRKEMEKVGATWMSLAWDGQAITDLAATGHPPERGLDLRSGIEKAIKDEIKDYYQDARGQAFTAKSYGVGSNLSVVLTLVD